MNTTSTEIVTHLRPTIVKYSSGDGTLLDMVMTTVGILGAMALLSCLCCLCMKLSDLRLRACVIEKAKKKGLNVDLEDYKRGCDSPHASENCTIMVPDVGYIL